MIIKGNQSERRRHTSKESMTHLRVEKDFHSADLAREERTTTRIPSRKPLYSWTLFNEKQI
jgi:hypothetical protein